MSESPLELALGLDVAVGAISEAVLLLLNVEEGSEADLFAPHDLRDAIHRTVGRLTGLAGALGIDADRAVSEKFNKTSAKYGLATRMEIN